MNNNDFAEYIELLTIARTWTDDERIARSMVEACFRGRLDRERIEAALAEMAAAA